MSDVANENQDKVREGLLSVLAGRSIAFSNNNANLVAIFDDPINRFSGGRVLLFQQFFQDRMGFIPQIVREVPHCMKIHFDVGELDTQETLLLGELLKGEEFRKMCRGVNVTQVQFGSRIVLAK